MGRNRGVSRSLIKAWYIGQPAPRPTPKRMPLKISVTFDGKKDTRIIASAIKMPVGASSGIRGKAFKSDAAGRRTKSAVTETLTKKYEINSSLSEVSMESVMDNASTRAITAPVIIKNRKARDEKSSL